MNLVQINTFAAKIDAMKPRPNARGEGIRIAKAYRETHAALLRPAINAVLVEHIEMALKDNGFEQELMAQLRGISS